jgi:4-diphosphocytidyl-2-C-methyl-D-erythritol kinase
MAISIPAHAKLNLGLRVFPARPDGFHDLETWMVRISWHDTIAIEDSSALQLAVIGKAEGVPVEIEKNLVGRAALTLAAAASIAPRGRIVLHKNLPPGGGIGGGSGDAAATLVTLNQAWNLHYPPDKLEAIAATLGSDISFFIRGIPSLCTGRGEIMTPLAPRRPLFAVLLIPPFGCPTKDVYQAFDRGVQHMPARPPTDWQKCAAASADELSELLVNDLEPAAFSVAPGLTSLRERAAKALHRRVHLTGSGSTLFVLFDSRAEADGSAVRVGEEFGNGVQAVSVQILL